MRIFTYPKKELKVWQISIQAQKIEMEKAQREEEKLCFHSKNNYLAANRFGLSKK